jgi:hypothetical protein
MLAAFPRFNAQLPPVAFAIHRHEVGPSTTTLLTVSLPSPAA